MRRFHVSAAFAAVSSVGALLVPWSGTSGAADPTVLPMTSFSHLLMDDAHSHIYLTDNSKVVVRALDGSPVTEIAEPGASGMAISPDGKTLYVALTTANAIAAISTSTLAETARYATGANTCPASVQPVAAKVWFGYGCAAGKGAIGLLAWALGKPSVALNRATGFNQAPELRFTSTIANKLFASGDFGRSAPVLKSFPITSNTSLGGSKSVGLRDGLADLSITPDGKYLVTASTQDNYVWRYKTADLTLGDLVQVAGYVNAAAVSSSGLVAAGLTASSAHDAWVLGPGGNLLKMVDFAGFLANAGLAFDAAGKTLYAVSVESGGALHLRVVQHPDQADVAVTMTGPAAVSRGQATTFWGTVSTLGRGFAGQTLGVQRVDASGTTTLAPVTTYGDGGFSFTDAPPTIGAATYNVSYAGDSAHLPATGSLTVQVTVPATTLTLSGTGNISAGGTESLTGVLTSGQAAVSGAVVSLTRTGASGTIQLGQFTTDGNGRFSAVDTPSPAGSYTYSATFAGTAAYSGSTASLNVYVSDPATSLTLSAPQSVPLGQPVPLSGRLTYGGNPIPNATVTLTREDTSGNRVQIGQVVTGTTGSYSTSDTTGAGSYRYTAAFAGNGTYAGSSAFAYVSVTAPASVLTLTGPNSLPIGHVVVLTGTLRTASGAPIAGATIHVGASGSGTGTAAQWQPQSVVTDSQGNYTITDSPPTTVTSTAYYYVNFYGDSLNGGSENKWTVQFS